MPAPPPAATRRTALGGTLAALVALSGCDLDDLDPRDDDPTAAATTGTPVDADQTLVEEVISELARMMSVLAAAQARFPRLRPMTRQLRSLHAVHLDALAGDVAEPVLTGAPTTPAAAHRDIRVQEARLQRRLADWSVAAESGALARLLASMSAAVAQQLAAPAASPGPTPGDPG